MTVETDRLPAITHGGLWWMGTGSDDLQHVLYWPERSLHVLDVVVCACKPVLQENSTVAHRHGIELYEQLGVVIEVARMLPSVV